MTKPEAFDKVVAEYYSALIAYALRRVPGRPDADDVVAETFAVAWRRREEMPETPLPWLYGVASRVIRNQRRSARRLGRLRAKLGSEPVILAPDPAEVAGESDAFAFAFAGLTDGQRDVLRLVAWEGLDSREASVALGCSESAFRVRLHRARRELAKRMDRAGHVTDEMPVSDLRSEPE